MHVASDHNSQQLDIDHMETKKQFSHPIHFHMLDIWTDIFHLENKSEPVLIWTYRYLLDFQMSAKTKKWNALIEI